MKKNINSLKTSEAHSKRRKLGSAVERKPQEVMAELVAKLAEQLDVEVIPAAEGNKGERDRVRPNLDRLTVGVDLGTSGATTAFWVYPERRWQKASFGHGGKRLRNSFRAWRSP